MKSLWVSVASALLIAGCAHGKIPQTNIDDTDENRELLKIVETYHRAIEARDVDALVSLLSPRYYEDNGNTNSEDDYSLVGLKTGISSEFESTKDLQLKLRVDSIEIDENEDKAFVYVFYTIRAQTEFPAGTKWKTATDRARFEFERKDGRWLLLAGI